MPHPLDGARFKVVWAQKHIKSLKSEIKGYLDQHADEIRSQPHMTPQHTWLPPVHVLKAIIPSETSQALSGIIGDIATNTRAALDYIAWELAQRYFVPKLDIAKFKDRKLASFPICDTPAEIKDSLDGLADRKIPAGAVREIEAAQPYNAGYEPIRLLAKLVNQDKHRLLLPTMGEVDGLTIEFAQSEVDGFELQRPISIPRKNLAAIGKNPVFQSDMQMKAKAPIYVTWKDVSMPQEPLDRTLENIVKCVADIVPRFDSFFI
jgi:hypothetical protein